MSRLSHEAVGAASRYVKARYSHWTKSQRKHRRKQVLRALKKESPEDIDEYVRKVDEALTRSGL
jgi:hypothetical protein